MVDEVESLISKLREIEEQALAAATEVKAQGLTNARLRQIIILAKFVRLRLAGESVHLDSLTPDGENKPRRTEQ